MARARRAAVAGLAAILLLAALAASAFAHAELIGAEPPEGALLDRPPGRVRLFFNEPIEREFFALEVYAADRTRVDRRDAAIPRDNVAALEASLPELGPGTYTVVWRVLSIDGHVVRGAYAFSVGAATPGGALRIDLAGSETASAGSVVRWLTYLAAFALVGGFGFLPLVLWPALRAAGLSGVGLGDRAARRLLWVAWPSVGALLLLGFAALLLQAAEVAGLPLGEVLGGRAVTRLLLGTNYGTLWFARLAALLGLVALVAVASAEARPSRWVRWAGLALGAGFLLTLAASGHAVAVQRLTGLAVAADWVHLLAGALWVGGLVALAVTLPGALRQLDPAGRRALLGRLVPRFSALATACVAALALTGLYSALVHVPSLAALADTAYGAALSGKLLLVAPLLALGAVNLLVLGPRFRRALDGKVRPAAEATSQRAFRLVVLGEVTLAALVLAVTGVLTGLPPATTAPGEGRPVAETRRVGDLSVTLAVSPNQIGTNRLLVTLADPQGQPVVAERVLLALSHLDMEMGVREVVAQPTGPGAYEATGGYLSMAGRWQAEVRLRRPGGGELTARFAFQVGQAPGAGRPAFSPARILANAASPRALVGLAMLVVAAFVWSQRGSFRRPRDRQASAVLAVALLAFGLFSTGATLVNAYRDSLPNPIPATLASIDRGRAVYTQYCAACHGATGRGDGPAGLALRPRPADFRVHMAAGHTDAQLFDWVTNGVEGTAMPAFKDQLSPEDRWHVINYLRTFADPTLSGAASDGGPTLTAAAAPPPAGSPAGAAAPITPTPRPTATPVPPTPAPTASPWVVVASWTGSAPMTTEPFTVRGPWRIRWRVASAEQGFSVMVLAGSDSELLNGPDGVTEGVFELPSGGAFSLMVHNTVPYEVVVEDAAGR